MLCLGQEARALLATGRACMRACMQGWLLPQWFAWAPCGAPDPLIRSRPWTAADRILGRFGCGAAATFRLHGTCASCTPTGPALFEGCATACLGPPGMDGAGIRLPYLTALVPDASPSSFFSLFMRVCVRISHTRTHRHAHAHTTLSHAQCTVQRCRHVARPAAA